jgi:hypothetical protein
MRLAGRTMAPSISRAWSPSTVKEARAVAAGHQCGHTVS